MLLISEVASEGRDFERRVHLQKSPKLRTIEQSLSGWNFEDMQSVEENSGAGQRPALERPTAVGMLDRKTSVSNANKVIEEGHRNPFTGTLSPSQRIKVAQLLDHWEEPETVQKRQTGASINAILQFRQGKGEVRNALLLPHAFLLLTYSALPLFKWNSADLYG